MSIRADWRLSELLDAGDDPFETIIMSSGLSVDLTGSEADLQDGIKRTLRVEEQLFAKGVTCSMKDEGQDCLTCTHFTARREDRRSRLCLIGRDQRVIENAHARKMAPLRELATLADDLSETGHLAEEYAELLTAAGR